MLLSASIKVTAVFATKESSMGKAPRQITADDIKAGTRIVYPHLGQAFAVSEITDHGTMKLILTHGKTSPEVRQTMNRGVPHADILWVFVDRYNQDHHTRIDGVDDDFEAELNKLDPLEP